MTEPGNAPEATVSRDISDLARGTAANLAGTAARTSRLLATVVATNLFGPAVYGLYDTGWKIAFIFAKVARFGLDRGVARAMVEARLGGNETAVSRAVGEGLSLALLASAAGGAGLWLGAEVLGRFYGQPTLGPALRVMCWALPLLGLSTVLLAATRALRTMRYEVYVQSMGGPLVLLAATLVAGLARAGIRGLAAAQVLAAAGMLAQSLVYFRRCFRQVSILGSLKLPTVRGPLARFSLPVMLSDVLTTAIWSLDQFILLKFAPASSVGVYAVARQASTLLKKAPQASGPILGPIVAQLCMEGRPRELGSHLAFLFRWTLVANLAYLGPVWLLGDRLLLVFGEEFAQGAEVFWILSLGMIAYGVSLPLESLLIMRGRPYANLACNGLWLAALVALSLWLIPLWGALGAAWASTLSLVAVTLLRLGQAMLSEGVQPLRVNQLKPVAAAVAGAGVGAAARSFAIARPLISDALTLLCFICVYCLALYLLGFEADDRRLLRGAVARLRHWTAHFPRRRGHPEEGRQ